MGLKSYKILKINSEKFRREKVNNEQGKKVSNYIINSADDFKQGEFKDSVITINSSFISESLRLLKKRDYVKDMFLPEFILVEFDSKSTAITISKFGFYYNNEHYIFFNSSPSWIKQKCIMFIKDEDKLRDRIEYLISIGKSKEHNGNVTISKEDARYALGWSGAERINSVPNFIVVDNPKNIITSKVHYTEEVETGRTFVNGVLKEIHLTKKLKTGEKTIENTLFDGCGICSIEYSQEIAKKLHLKGDTPCWYGIRMYGMSVKGVISAFDINKWFEENNITHIKDIWGDMKPVEGCQMIINGSMAKWWNKYKSFKEYKERIDLFEAKAVWKQLDGLWIVKYEKPLSTYTTANYQLLGNLALRKRDILELAEYSKKHYMDIYKNDYDKTMLFLGNINNEDDIDLDSENDDNILKVEESLSSKLSTVLATQPKMLDDTFVKISLRRLLQKKIEQMMYGKIYIKGNFKTCIQDSVMFMQYISGIHTQQIVYGGKEIIIMSDEAGCLNTGEFFTMEATNGDTHTLCRHPLNCFLEIKNVQMVKNELTEKWLGHYKNMIMFNGKDLSVNIFSGNDFDLDLIFDIDNEIIRKAVVEGLPIVNVDDGKHKATEGEFDIKNRVITMTSSFGNLIGSIANISKTHSAFGNAQDVDGVSIDEIKSNMIKKLETLVCLTHYGMEAIDAPKTSYTPKVPDDFKIRNKPYYHKYCTKHKGYDTPEWKLIKMPCALNYLCWDIEKWYKEIKWDFGQHEVNMDIAREYIVNAFELIEDEEYSLICKKKIEEFLKDYYRKESDINLKANNARMSLDRIKKEIKENREQKEIEAKNLGIKLKGFKDDREELITKDKYEEITIEKKKSLKTLQDESQIKFFQLNVKDTILASLIAQLIYIEHPSRSKNPLWTFAFEGFVKNLRDSSKDYVYSFIRDNYGKIEYLGDRYSKIAIQGITDKHISAVGSKEKSKVKNNALFEQGFKTRVGKFGELRVKEVVDLLNNSEFILQESLDGRTKLVGLWNSKFGTVGKIFWDKGQIDEFTHLSNYYGDRVKVNVIETYKNSLAIQLKLVS